MLRTGWKPAAGRPRRISWERWRDICGLPTGSYNRFFVEVVRVLHGEEAIDETALRRAMSASQADVTRWPADDEWRSSWLGRDQYRASRQPRLPHILEAIEHERRGDEGEIVAIKTDLTVEHIMPQKWRSNWPVPGFDHLVPGDVDVDQMVRENEREESINKLGNLTLLTQKLNSSVSNGAYSVKLPAVRAHAALTINRDLHAYDRRDEETIVARGVRLFEFAKRIWPGPA